MIRTTAIIPHIVSYIIVAIAFFVAGAWVQSGRVEVKTNTVTKYIPNFGSKYIDLPDFRYPIYSYITIEKKVISTRVDTIRVPVEIKKIYVLPQNGIRVNDKYVYVKTYDTDSGQYVIDQYKVPKPNFSHDISFQLLANPAITGNNIFAGLSARASYKRLGLSAQALISPKSDPLFLTGLSIKLY